MQLSCGDVDIFIFVNFEVLCARGLDNKTASFFRHSSTFSVGRLLGRNHQIE